jgi:cysteine desulfurase/selenocysteine lyase
MIDRTVRDDFIGLEQRVFLNNAAYGPMLKVVREAIDTYLGGVAKLRAVDVESIAKLEEARQHCAELVGADTEEIGFAYNTSFGLNLAVTGLDYQVGDEVIVADNEFPAVTYPFNVLESKGVKIRLAPTVENNLSLEEVEKLVTDRTRVLAISFVQYFNGYRNDVKWIGEFCRDRGIFYVVDGIQGIGACPIDVHDCHIDIMGCGGQKWLMSIPGTGFFFASRTAKLPVRSWLTGWFGVDWGMDFTDLRHFDREPYGDARRFNLGTYPFLHLWALEASTRYLMNLGVEKIYQHNIELLDRLVSYVQGSDFYQLRSSIEPEHRSGIISVGSPAGKELAQYLIKQGIFLVYREGGVRVAVNFYNTLDEIEFLIEKLEKFRSSR